MLRRVFALSFGGNKGNVHRAFQRTLYTLEGHNLVSELKVSSVYKTEPWGDVTGGDFHNAAVTGFWLGSDLELLQLCQSCESHFGVPVRKQNEARFLDIDILFIEDGVSSEELILPHPRMHLRQFVLLPLSEIWAGNIIGLGKTPFQLLELVQDESSIIFEGILSLS